MVADTLVMAANNETVQALAVIMQGLLLIIGAILGWRKKG